VLVYRYELVGLLPLRTEGGAVAREAVLVGVLEPLLRDLKGSRHGEDVLALLDRPDVDRGEGPAVRQLVRFQLHVVRHVPRAQEVAPELVHRPVRTREVLGCS
jgi:hypothetical protein